MGRTLFELVGEIAVRGADASERAIEAVDQSAATLSQGIDRAGQRIQGFGDGLSEAGDKATVFSGALVAAGVGAGQFITGVTESAERSLELSERLGVNIEFLQEWTRIARRFGIEAEALRDGFKELSLRADEFAQTGSGPAAEALERLGLSQEEVAANSDNVEGFFRMVLDRIRQVQGASARQRIADELFGGQAGEQFTELLGASRSEIDALLRQVRESGGIFSKEEAEKAREFNRQIQAFQERMGAIGREIVINVLPQIMQVLPVIEQNLVPALQGTAETIADLIRWFSELSPAMQETILTATALAVAFGPILAIFGRVISVFGSVVSMLGRLAGATRIVTGLFGVARTVLAPIIAVVSKLSALLGAFWAGWEIGSRVLVPLLRMFPEVWNAIGRAVAAVVNWRESLATAWNAIKSLLGQIAEGFSSAFSSIHDTVVGTISDMVDTAIAKIQSLYDTLVGNSIIPDLANDTISEFDRMAGGSESAGERMRRSMTDAMGSVGAPAGAAAAGAGGGGNTTIDLSHSTFQNDQDMLDRLRRNGADVSGAFAA